MGTVRVAAARNASGVRSGWFAEAIIAGFVATGAATCALVVGYLVAASLSAQDGNQLSAWLWQLTNNSVVVMGRGAPALAALIHIVTGLVLAMIYARFFEPNSLFRSDRGGMLFSLIPWLLSLVVFLPLVGGGMFGMSLNAGPMPAIGNLIVHLVYGFTLGRLYEARADETAAGSDATFDEELSERADKQAEQFGAGGIVIGLILGGVLGLLIGFLPGLQGLEDGAGGYTLAYIVGGVLAGGAVGAIVGSFSGLPSAGRDPSDVSLPPDPLERSVLPFFLVLGIVLGMAAIIVGVGLLLLMLHEFHIEGAVLSLPVIAALVLTVLIALGGWLLARGSSTPQEPETSAHRGH